MRAVHHFLSAAALLCATAAQSAVIDFGAGACAAPCSNGATIVQGFGDTSRLNATYDDGNLGTLRFWDTGYSAISGVAYGDLGLPGRIELRAVKGVKVTLKGFVLGAWQGVDRQSSYRIYNGRGELLFDSGTVTVSGASGLVVAGKWKGGRGITLEFGPEAYYVGIDKIGYKLTETLQSSGPAATLAKSGPHTAAPPMPAVPVPASLPLLAGAIIGLALLRRRFARA